MAKRWTAAQALEALAAGNPADRTDIARRFPLFATAKPEEVYQAAVTFVTTRQIEAALRGEDPGGESAEQAEEVLEQPKPVKPKPAPKQARTAPASEDDDDDDTALDDLFEDDDDE